MSEPVSLWGVLKSFLGIFSSISKEVIKYFNQPKLVIKATRTTKHRNSYRDTIKPMRIPLIGHNMMPTEKDIAEQLRQLKKLQEEEKQYEEAIVVSREYKLEWKYDIVLTNNSEHTAYKLKLLKSSSVTEISDTDYTKPIPPNQSVTYSITVEEDIIATKADADRQLLEGGDFELQAEYSNVRGTRYFTLFHSEADVEEQNQFGRVK